MILSVNLNPRIVVNVEVDALSVGKTTQIVSKRTFYTGKALNAAIGLSRLDVDCFLTGFMYEDNGRVFEHELHKAGVDYKFIWNKGRVSESYKIIDNKSMLTELNDLSPEVSKDKQEELLSLVTNLAHGCEGVIIAGGLVKGMAADYYGKLLSVLPQDIIKVVDTDGEQLFEALKCGVDLVKPNLEELKSTLKVEINNKDDLLAACRKLIAMGTKIVLVSLGKKGAVITDGQKSYYSKSINVAVNSTLGAGDAMVAAATNALIQHESLPNILRAGVAAGTAAVTLPDSISFKKSKFDEILATLDVKEI